MSNQDFDDQEIQRAPPRARQTRKVKKKPQRRAQQRAPEPEVRAEAPVRRNSPRPPPRSEGTRDTNREPARRGAVVAVGHDGEQLTRRRTAVGDRFELPKNEIPTGWEYQWNAVTVLNMPTGEIIRGDLQMHENGWRPVPASRHPGRWAPHGFEGGIIIDGLRLEERPESLGIEARQEDKLRAGAQVRDRTDALRLTQKSLPGAGVAAQRNQAGGMRMSIDTALDLPKASGDYDLAEE